MKRKSFFTAFSVLAALAINPLLTSAERFADLFNNSNSAGVANHPTNPTMFTLNARASISELVTYHWNNGRGARPGTIGLRSQTGQIFGPFAARGVAGQGGAPNVNWVATPNATLPAGTYTVLDSDPGTWSHNSQSFSRGFVIVRGSLLAPKATPLRLQVSAEQNPFDALRKLSLGIRTTSPVESARVRCLAKQRARLESCASKPRQERLICNAVAQALIAVCEQMNPNAPASLANSLFSKGICAIRQCSALAPCPIPGGGGGTCLGNICAAENSVCDPGKLYNYYCTTSVIGPPLSPSNWCSCDCC